MPANNLEKLAMTRAKSFEEQRNTSPDANSKYQSATPSLLKRWRRATVKKGQLNAKEKEVDITTPLDDLICLDSFHEISGEHEPKIIVSRDAIKSSLQELLKSNGGRVDVLTEVESRSKITPSNAETILRTYSTIERNIAFLAAALYDRSDLIKAFIACEVDIAYQEPKLGFNALHISAFCGATKVVEMLISHGINVNPLLQATFSALHCAALGNNPDSSRILLQNNASVSKTAIGGETVLHSAVRARSSACIRIFVDHEADVSAIDSCGITPLHLAADLGDVDCVRVLVDSDKCDIEQTTRTEENTALHLAAQGGFLEVVTLLLDRGAQPNAKNGRMKTPLHFSSKVCAECTEALLRRGADPNACDIECRTPLHAAVSRSEVRFGPDITTLLLNWNASVNAQDRYGYTALHIAALNEQTECVESLLKHNADVSARTRGGTLALGLIARKTPTAIASLRHQLDACITCNDPEVSYKEVRMSFNFRYLLRSGDRGEMSFLQTFVDEGQRELLEHPLCEAFLRLKWEKIRKYYAMRLIFCFLLVFLLSVYVVTALAYQCYHPVQPAIASRLHTSFKAPLCDNKTKFGEWLLQRPGIIEAEWYFLLAVTILEISRKLYGLNGYKNVREYLTLGNLVEWFVIIAVFATSFIYTGDTHVWQNHVGAFAVLFGWANLMIMIGKLPEFGSYVVMYTKVQKEFAKLLSAYVCLLIGFTICFCVIFVNSPAFDNPLIGFVKILAMMVGEFELGELLKDIKGMDGRFPAILPLFTFVLFLLFVTIILINLMIGIAVHDIQGLQKTAGLSKLVGLTNLISHIETALFANRIPVYITKVLNASARLRRVVVTVKPLNPQEKMLPRDLMRSALEIARQVRCKRLEEKRNTRLELGKNRYVSISGNQDIIDLLLCLSQEVKELKRLAQK